jgi:hypothetical protein
MPMTRAPLKLIVMVLYAAGEGGRCNGASGRAEVRRFGGEVMLLQPRASCLHRC